MKRSIFLLSFLLLTGVAFGQVKFSYDNAGNRIKRFTGSGARIAADEPFLSAEESIGDIAIYPNPVKDRFQLQVPDAGGVKRVSVINSSGVAAKEIPGYPSDGVEVSRLPAGVYITIIEFQSGQTSTVRFIKE